MKLSRDTWLAIGLLLLLALVSVPAAITQARSKEIPYLSTSSSPSGLLALKLWLKELGIQTVGEVMPGFDPPQNADIILIIQPLLEVSENEWKLIDKWVDEGGTLLLAGDLFPSYLAFRHYEFEVSFLLDRPAELTSQTPLLSSPPLADSAPVRPAYYLTSERSDFVTHLAANDLPVLVSFEQGKGRVILSATPYPFSNLALKNEANAELVLNLLALSVQEPAVAWLDDWHHGVQGNTIIGPGQWLRGTPLGHALLFITGVIFVALLMRGRGFGRPIPLPHEIKRRGPLEHVTAIANLNRKAGHRDTVLQQYRHHLKRHLGRRYRLDSSLADAEYLHSLARLNPELDIAALTDLLKRLSQKNPGENEIVRLAAETSKWMDNNR